MSDPEEPKLGADPGGGGDDFEAALEAAVAEAYPVLLQRVEHAQFGGWHRRRGQQGDLANEAAFRLIQHCRRNRQLPDDPVGYLVKIARNVAKKQYARREADVMDAAGFVPLALPDAESLGGENVDELDPNLQRESQLELVRAGIEMLTPRLRETLRLYLSEPNTPYKKLGAKMGIGEDGFQKNLERGVEKIRQLLAVYGLTNVPVDEQ